MTRQFFAELQAPANILFNVDASPTPAGAFGIISRPDELLHYVLDVLERRDFDVG